MRNTVMKRGALDLSNSSGGIMVIAVRVQIVLHLLLEAVHGMNSIAQHVLLSERFFNS